LIYTFAGKSKSPSKNLHCLEQNVCIALSCQKCLQCRFLLKAMQTFLATQGIADFLKLKALQTFLGATHIQPQTRTRSTERV
jgi:hypothetical protein